MDTKKHQLPTPFPTALTCAEKYYLKYTYIYILFASFVHCRVFAVCIHFQEAGKNHHQKSSGSTGTSSVQVQSHPVIASFDSGRKKSLNKIIRKFEKVMQLFDCCFCLKGTKCGSEATS